MWFFILDEHVIDIKIVILIYKSTIYINYLVSGIEINVIYKNIGDESVKFKGHVAF